MITDVKQFEKEYHETKAELEKAQKVVNSIKKKIEPFKEFLQDALYTIVRPGSDIDNFRIKKVEDGIVYVSFSTSWRNEWEEDFNESIPLKYCDSLKYLKHYLENREAKKLSDEEDKIKKEQEEKEHKVYLNLKKKFEG